MKKKTMNSYMITNFQLTWREAGIFQDYHKKEEETVLVRNLSHLRE